MLFYSKFEKHDRFDIDDVKFFFFFALTFKLIINNYVIVGDAIIRLDN